MTFSLPVVLLLTTCLLLPAIAIPLSYRLLITSTSASSPREMVTTLKGLRADVRDLDLDARRSGWRRPNWSGPTGYVQAQVADASHEVMVLVPYAETSVLVGFGTDNSEWRRCSLCLN